ncbi:MAG: amidohydrolase family protein [Acidobacteriota bacterium]|nr:amidohydrolase family protein [Acidobacteriota bacterium]
MKRINREKRSKSFKGKAWRKGKFADFEFHVEDGRISQGLKGEAIEASYIFPPFADPHIHGGWGLSFQKGEFEPLEKNLKSEGILFVVPTLYNDDLRKIKQISKAFKSYKKKNPESIFPFLMVEGPFISRKKKGFQQEEFILSPNEKNIEKFLSIEEIKVFTFAPELKGVEELVQKALLKGKIPSVGHSNAKFQDLLKFYKMGIRHMTHFPNAMSSLHHREIGLLGGGLFLKDLQLEVVADGIHSCFEFISLLLKVKGPDFTIISDMIPPAYSNRKKFGGKILQKYGKRISSAQGTLAGGCTSVSEQAQWLFQNGLTQDEIVHLACLNTLKYFGFRLPSIDEGEDASFVLLDKHMKVMEVYSHGERV